MKPTSSLDFLIDYFRKDNLPLRNLHFNFEIETYSNRCCAVYSFKDSMPLLQVDFVRDKPISYKLIHSIDSLYG